MTFNRIVCLKFHMLTGVRSFTTKSLEMLLPEAPDALFLNSSNVMDFYRLRLMLVRVEFYIGFINTGRKKVFKGCVYLCYKILKINIVGEKRCCKGRLRYFRSVPSSSTFEEKASFRVPFAEIINIIKNY